MRWYDASRFLFYKKKPEVKSRWDYKLTIKFFSLNINGDNEQSNNPRIDRGMGLKELDMTKWYIKLKYCHNEKAKTLRIWIITKHGSVNKDILRTIYSLIKTKWTKIEEWAEE